MVLALDRAGCDLSVTARRGFLHRADFPLPPRLLELMDKPRSLEVDLTFEYPPNYRWLHGEMKVALLVYETTVLPPHWADAIRKYVDMLVVPSTFCRDVVLDAGIPESRVRIVPYGYDPEMLRAHDEVRPLIESPAFVFLHVATPHKRKGTELLIEAFAEEFRGDDGVLLLVKSTYSARRAKARPFEIANIDEAIRNQRGSSTRILHLVDVLSPEEMSRLYRTANCVVQPSFSEGFGLVILEAMALGLPVVVTGWGGQMDFCTAQNTFLLDYDLVPAGECQYDCDSIDALMAMPQLGHLRERLRFVYDHRDDAERVGGSAARDVADMTWDTSARQLVDVISDMRTAEIDERNEAQRCVN